MDSKNRYRVFARTNDIGTIVYEIVIDDTVVGLVNPQDMEGDKCQWIRFYLEIYEAGRFGGFLDSFKDRGVYYNKKASINRHIQFDVFFPGHERDIVSRYAP